jgi:Flp pilus assembly protein protease CpaA
MAPIPILWIALAILAVATAFDLRSREIPDTLSVCLLGLAAVATGFRLHDVGWVNLALGLGIGLGIGLVLFRLGGFGGGDVKLLASLGAVLGWRDELGAMFYMALWGGCFALVAALRKEREFPYAPAIALGLLAFIVRGYLR